MGRPAVKWVAPRARRKPPSSAPRAPKRGGTDDEKERKRKAEELTRSFRNLSRRTAWRELGADSLWTWTSSTMTWSAPPHTRFSMICQYDLWVKTLGVLHSDVLLSRTSQAGCAPYRLCAQLFTVTLVSSSEYLLLNHERWYDKFNFKWLQNAGWRKHLFCSAWKYK